MRGTLLSFVVGCGLAAASLAPAFACAFHDAQASDKPAQQTAQAQSSSDVKSQ